MGHINFVNTLCRSLVKQSRQPRIGLQLTPDTRSRKFDTTASQADLHILYKGWVKFSSFCQNETFNIYFSDSNAFTFFSLAYFKTCLEFMGVQITDN
jgi:hypothetical protein